MKRNYSSHKSALVVRLTAVNFILFFLSIVVVQAQSGTVTFTGNDGDNIGQSLNDGTNSNDIAGILLDIFCAMTSADATSRTNSGSFTYWNGPGLGGYTYDQVIPIDVTSGNSYVNESNLPTILVIMSNDGSEFSFQSIYICDFLDGNQAISKFEGFKDGVSTGSVNLSVNGTSHESTFTTSDFSTAIFGDVDEVRISNVSMSQFYAGFNNITIGEVVVPATTPTVTTQAVSDITTTTATGNGNVTATGGANITERGIYYSTTDGFADGAGTKVSATGDWSVAGAFTQAITGLTAGTTYYLKAFATNSVGTSYGSQVSFLTQSAPIVTASQSFSIAEDITNAASVGTVLATDADAGTTFSSWTETGGTGAAIFEIDAATGDITVTDNTSIDYETTTSYTYTVTVSDGTNTSEVETITINITDVNDVTPVITASQSFNVDEDAANTASVGTVLATDADVTVTIYSSWTITAGNGDAIFAIDASTGAITVDDNTNLDYETTTSYTLTLTVSDGINTSATETISIGINPKNDNDPVVTASQTFSIAEDIANTASVGTALATDADAGTTFSSWTETGGTGAAIFEIDAATGDITVTDNASIDYETTTSYTYTVTVSDGTNTSAVESVTITVTDVNDVSPVITASQSFNIDEDAANTTSVGTVLATDGDVTATTFSSWTITAGNGDGIFAINSSTGELTVLDNTNLDYETTTSYTLTLTVSDGINTSATETVVVGINPNNISDPVVTANQTFSIAEDIANTASVGTALATDADAGTTFSSWTETGGTGASIFEINASTGTITVTDNSSIDYETTTSYTYTITVSDGTNTSEVETITINITDVNDVSPVITASQSFNIDEDAANTTSLGTVLATDGDVTATTFSSWTITAGNGDGIFAINSSTGELTVLDNTNLDYITTPSYSLLITVSDGVNTSASEIITINVNGNSVPTIAFNTTASSGLESVSSADLQVDLSATSASDVTVDYTVTGTANGSGIDYSLANGTLTILAGSTTANISIASIADDAEVEGDETVIVTLSNPSNATLGTNTAHTYTIIDNDEATSVSEISESLINVFPNPFKNTIHLDNINGNLTKIVITNICGQIVLNSDYNGEPELDLTHLKNSAYLMILENREGVRQIIKIVKQ